MQKVRGKNVNIYVFIFFPLCFLAFFFSLFLFLFFSFFLKCVQHGWTDKAQPEALLPTSRMRVASGVPFCRSGKSDPLLKPLLPVKKEEKRHELCAELDLEVRQTIVCCWVHTSP